MTVGLKPVLASPNQNISNPKKQFGQKETMATRAAQKRAHADIDAARKTVKAAQENSNTQLESIRSQHDKRKSAIMMQNEQEIQEQHTRGYEKLADIKRQQQLEIQRARQQGQKQLAQLKEHILDEQSRTKHKSDMELTELKNSHVSQQRAELDNQNFLKDKSQTEAQRRKEFYELEEQKKLRALKNEAQTKLEKTQENYRTSNTKAYKNLEKNYQTRISEYNKISDHLNKNAVNQLQNIQNSNARGIADYASRAEDPFYQMVEIQPQFEETENAYRITANVPLHERDKVTISVNGNQAVISGTRVSDEKQEVSPGHVKKTSSYQTYNEVFNLDYPVEERMIRREEDGGTITFHIPKKGPNSRGFPHQRAQPERARAESPNFPDSIQKQLNKDLAEAKIAQGSRASRPFDKS